MMFGKSLFNYAKAIGGLKVAKYMSRNHPKILMYHRISGTPTDTGIAKELFRNQVKMIKKEFFPMTLRNLIKSYEEGCLPKNAVVLTFDDGYYDFGDIAFPILKEEGVPATLFITTGFVNGDLWLWPDKVDFLLYNYNSIFFNSLINAFPNLKVDDTPEVMWGKICDQIINKTKEEREYILREMSKIMRVCIPSNPPSKYRALTWGSLRNMIKDGIDVENHSYSHPILSCIGKEEVLSEVSKSKELIEKNLGISSNIFCYPNGMSKDYSEEVKESLKTLGYFYSVTAFPKTKPLVDRMEIGRYPVSTSQSGFIKNALRNLVFENAIFLKQVMRSF